MVTLNVPEKEIKGLIKYANKLGKKNCKHWNKGMCLVYQCECFLKTDCARYIPGKKKRVKVVWSKNDGTDLGR